jgi:hypothetical protein
MSKRLTVFTVAALLALVTGLSAAHAQPAATITLPEPGGTKQLYPGCNAVALTFPNGTTSQAVANAVSPAGSVQAIWSYDTAYQKFAAFSPAAPQASDLLSVSFLQAVWVCVARADAPPVAIVPTVAPPPPLSPPAPVSPRPGPSVHAPPDSDLYVEISYRDSWEDYLSPRNDVFDVRVENRNFDWYACSVVVYIDLFDEWGSLLWSEPVWIDTVVEPWVAVEVTTSVRHPIYEDTCEILGENCWTQWAFGGAEWMWSLNGCY